MNDVLMALTLFLIGMAIGYSTRGKSLRELVLSAYAALINWKR